MPLKDLVKRVGPQPEKSEEQQELVTKVKTAQRQSEQTKQKWWAWADTKGGGIRDPARHSAKFLNEFFEALENNTIPDPEAGLAPGADERAELVNRVKRGQRTNTEFKQQWWLYCDTIGGGIRDPSRHDVEYLKRFFEKYAPAGTDGKPGLTPAEELEKGGLVRYIEFLRTQDGAWEYYWRWYCDAHGGGIPEPKMHRTEFLQKFLVMISSGEGEVFFGKAEEEKKTKDTRSSPYDAAALKAAVRGEKVSFEIPDEAASSAAEVDLTLMSGLMVDGDAQDLVAGEVKVKVRMLKTTPELKRLLAQLPPAQAGQAQLVKVGPTGHLLPQVLQQLPVECSTAPAFGQQPIPMLVQHPGVAPLAQPASLQPQPQVVHAVPSQWPGLQPQVLVAPGQLQPQQPATTTTASATPQISPAPPAPPSQPPPPASLSQQPPPPPPPPSSELSSAPPPPPPPA
eukprot:TRINITY_DN2660_c0_g4_i1.p1 TRINITY_DN2660_c0_g4~~TRINITY_DN2660_c0_g4_i1.p1  ORF type:complete len:454 (+),score=108.11 TRINITY_DN2660_c0_g4_i1:141-1502(+)